MSPSLRSVLRAALAGAIAATVASPAPAADKVAVGTGGSASDAPFGAEGGASYIRETMKVIASLDIAQPDKEKICYRNARQLFKLQ